MYLPLEKQKPCINVLSYWEDRTYRLYNSNMLENIAVLFVCTQSRSYVFFTHQILPCALSPWWEFEKSSHLLKRVLKHCFTVLLEHVLDFKNIPDNSVNSFHSHPSKKNIYFLSFRRKVWPVQPSYTGSQIQGWSTHSEPSWKNSVWMPGIQTI